MSCRWERAPDPPANGRAGERRRCRREAPRPRSGPPPGSSEQVVRQRTVFGLRPSRVGARDHAAREAPRERADALRTVAEAETRAGAGPPAVARPRADRRPGCGDPVTRGRSRRRGVEGAGPGIVRDRIRKRAGGAAAERRPGVSRRPPEPRGHPLSRRRTARRRGPGGTRGTGGPGRARGRGDLRIVASCPEASRAGAHAAQEPASRRVMAPPAPDGCLPSNRGRPRDASTGSAPQVSCCRT